MDPIKTSVRDIPAYTLAALDTSIKLNQNENPYDVPADIKKQIARYAVERPWSRYPDFVPDEFLTCLAGHIGWKADGILAGNGSNELIQAIFAVSCEPGATVLIAQPTFTLYKLMGSINNARIAEVTLNDTDYSFDVDRILDAIREEQPRVVVLCSPNNPTGCALSLDEWRSICHAAPGLVVADQAYVEFGGDSVVLLLEEFERLIVLRTFSKAGALAGLRVGYCACDPALAEQISKAKLPYNLNFFSMACATAVVENWSRFEETIDGLVRERERVSAALNDMEAVQVFPSQANFLLFETPHTPADVFRGVYDEGVLIRDVSKYPLLSQALRVSIGTPEENDAFLIALERTLRKLS